MNWAQLQGKRALITGGSGYLGSALAARLRELGVEVIALDRGRDGDIRHPESWAAWVSRIGPNDLIFHLAGQTSCKKADEAPLEDWHLNSAPLIHLSQACRRAGIRPRVVFASTATVVGMPERLPVDEECPEDPVTLYDLHKLFGEMNLRLASRQGVVEGVSLRLANVYGTMGRGPLSGAPDRGVINRMAQLALEGASLRVFGSGEWLRDYVHVSDVVEAFIAAAAAPAISVTGRSFNVATGVGTRFKDAVELLAELASRKTGRTVPVLQEPDVSLSPIDTRSYVGSPTRLREAAGWTPRLDLRSGLSDLLDRLSS